MCVQMFWHMLPDLEMSLFQVPCLNIWRMVSLGFCWCQSTVVKLKGERFFFKSWAVGENIIIEVVALHQGPEGTNRPSQP